MGKVPCSWTEKDLGVMWWLEEILGDTKEGSLSHLAGDKKWINFTFLEK